MVTSIFNLGLISDGIRNSHHICSCSLCCPHHCESIRGEQAQEHSLGALPPLIYLLFLARAVCRKGDAPKSNSHSQHSSHLSKKVAKGEWPSSNQLHSCYQHFQEELWDPGEPACVSIWSAQAAWGRIFCRLQKEDCSNLYAIHAQKTNHLHNHSTDYILLFRYKLQHLQRLSSPAELSLL